MTLVEAKRRYANARKRARFWAGNPSLSNFGPTGKNLNTGRMDEKYELAMCDCDSWERTIEILTGKRPKHYDPKTDFRRRFHAVMAKSWRSDGPVGMDEVVKLLPEMCKGLITEMVKT